MLCCYLAWSAHLRCLPPNQACVIAVWTASLETPHLAHCAARCAICLWGKSPLFADRCMFATAEACVVLDKMTSEWYNPPWSVCMQHVKINCLHVEYDELLTPH
jgi:hypothetical protein